MPAGSQQLSFGLWYQAAAAGGVVCVGGRSAPRPVLRLTAADGRARVDLLLLAGARAIDVSIQPAASVEVVRGYAVRSGTDPNGWLGALTAHLGREARRWGTWAPSEASHDALALFGGTTHPLLGLAFDAGVSPTREIPRWASAALAEADARSAAGRLFAVRPNRPLVQATARFIAGMAGRPLAWWRLAVAVAASSVLEPGDVVRVLSTPVLEEETRLPTVECLDAMRAGLALLGARRARALVTDATVTADGEERLGRVLRLLVEVERELSGPAPVTLEGLERACLRAAAIDPAPPAPRAQLVRLVVDPVRAGASPRPARPRSPRPEWAQPRRAPVASSPGLGTTTVFRHPPAVRALHDQVVDDVRLVIPRTPAELRTWGRVLSNCLGDFGASVAEGRSVIVGVRRGEVLVAALEVEPQNAALVQFLGENNRCPPASLTTPVIRRLEAAGLVAIGEPR